MGRPFLSNLDPAHGCPTIAFVAELSDEGINLPQRHAVHRFRRTTWGQRTGVSLDARVGPQVQLAVEEQPIAPLHRESLAATFSKDM